MNARYESTRLESASNLRRVQFTDAHRRLLEGNGAETTPLNGLLDHLTAWFDTDTGLLPVISQPYKAPSPAQRQVLALHGLALLDVPERLAPYRTTPGAPKTHAFLICETKHAAHFARVLRGVA